jgi:CRP/FNR family transcriptional regulator, cyclic AMP receptor protein
VSTLVVELPADEQRRARDVLDACPTIRLTAGSDYDRDDLPAAAIFVVEEGIALLVAEGGDATRRIVLALAAPGSVILPPTAGARLTALTDARVTAVSHAAYDALLREPAAAAALLAGLAEAVCDREESLSTFAGFPHVERVRAKLLQLARTHGKVTGDGVLIDLPLTHDVLADMVGSARETVTWALRQLTDEGFVARSGKFFRLAVPPGEIVGRRRSSL